MSDTLSLAITAAQPVIVTGLLAGAGALMAHQGTLRSPGCSVLAKLCFNIFTPSIVFVTLAQAVSLAAVRSLWPLLANMLLSIIVGFCLGTAAAAALRTPPEFRNHVITSVAFGNVGNLPLVFTAALCNDQDAVFYKSLGGSCHSLGVAYTAFNMCVAVIFQFSIAIQMLRPPYTIAGGLSSPQSPSSREDASERAALNGDCPEPKSFSAFSPPHYNKQPDEGHYVGSIELPCLPHVGSLSDWSHASVALHDVPNGTSSSREYTAIHLPGGGSSSSGNGHGGSVPSSPHGSFGSPVYTRMNSMEVQITDKGGRPGWQGWMRGSGGWGHKIKSMDWAGLFPLPTQAAFAGLVIGCVPFLKALMFGANPPLGVLTEALELLGEGLIPVAIPLLGAVLYRGPAKSSLPWRVTAGVLVTRLVLVPAAMTAIVVLLLHTGIYSLPDSMALLVMLLANATPTAINLQTITVLYKHGEAEMSTMLFYQYIASLVTLPAFVTLFLRIITMFEL